MSNNKHVGILFGVSGASISGKSGKLILEQLRKVATDISEKRSPKVIFNLNIPKTKSVIQKQLNDLAKDISFNVAVGDKEKPRQSPEQDYSDREKLMSAFHRRNLSQINFEIKARENASRIFSQDLKQRMLEQEAANASLTKFTKISNEMGSDIWGTKAKGFMNSPELESYNDLLQSVKEKIEDIVTGVGGRDLISADSLNTEKTKELFDVYDQLNDKLKLARSSNQSLRKDLSEDTGFESIAANARKFYEQIEHIISRSPEMEGKLQSFIARLDDRDFKDGPVQAKNEWVSLENEIRRAGLTTETFGQKLKTMFSRVAGYGAVTMALNYLRREVVQVYRNVVELDSAVTDLQIATGYTRRETEDLIISYSKLGKELGVTTSEVAKGADAWLRQGYSIENSNKLIKDSLMLSVLGQIGATESTKALTSAMKGYKVEVEDATGIVDKFTAVDMEAAVSAGGIATAMAQTAASANIAGISMDRLIGYIATVSEVTQDADEAVGNFYKTLFARMGNVKIGRLEDPETGESLSDVETVLSGVDIKLRDASDNFRDFDKVLDETASKWNNYSNVQKRAIARAFSGTRQQEKFLVLMENYGIALDYATVAADSHGTATAKFNDAYLNSVEAAQNAFIAQFEAFSLVVLDSDLIKGVYGTGTGILKFLTDLTDVLGALPALAMAVTAALSFKNIGMFKSDGSSLIGFDPRSIIKRTLGVDDTGLNKVSSAIDEYNSALSVSIDKANEYIGVVSEKDSVLGNHLKTLNGAPASVDGYSSSLAGAAAKSIALRAATIALNVGVTLIITGIFKLGQHLISLIPTLSNLTEKADKLKSELSELQSGFDAINSELRTTGARIKELKRLQSDGAISIIEKGELEELEASNIELERRVALLREELELKSKDTAKAVRAEFEKKYGEGSYTKQGFATDIDYQTRDALTQELLDVEAIMDDINSSYEEQGAAIERFNEINSQIEDIDYSMGLSEAGGGGIDLGTWIDQAIERYEELNRRRLEGIELFEDESGELSRLREEMVGTAVELDNYVDKYGIQDDISGQWHDWSVSISESLKTAEQRFNDVLSKDIFTKAKVQLENLGSQGELTGEQIKALYDSGSSGNLNLFINELIKVGAISDISEDSLDSLAVMFNKVKDEAEQVSVPLSELAGSFSDLIKELSSFNSALEEQEEHGSVSIATMMDMIASNENLISVFEIENGIITLNTAAYKSLALAKISELQAAKLSERQLLIDKLEEERKVVSDLARDYGKLMAWEIFGITASNNTRGKLDETETMLSSIQALIDGINNNNFSFTAPSTPSTSPKPKKEKTELELLNEEIREYIDLTEHEIFLLSKQESTEQKRINLYRQLQDEVHKYANTYREMHELGKITYSEMMDSVNSLQKEWWSYFDAIQGIIKTQSDLILDGYRKQKDAISEIIDLTKQLIKQEAEDQIDAINETIKGYEKIISLKKKLLDQNRSEANHQKTIEQKNKEIAKIQSEVVRLSLDDSREAHAERIALEGQLSELQSSLADYQADYSYEKQVETLDDELKKFKESKDGEIDIIKKTVDTEAKLYALAIDRINNSWSTLYSDLVNYSINHGDGIIDNIVSAWDRAATAAEKYGSVTNALSFLDDAISDEQSSNKAIVSMIASEMKRNSQIWHTASDSDKSRLSKANEDMAREISQLLGETIVKSKEGVWHIGSLGGRRLFDIYHDGGVAGNQPSVKQNELLSLLEKGELILDEDKQDPLFDLVDFANRLSGRLGDLSLNTPRSMWNRPSSVINSDTISSSRGNDLTFSPNIEVKIIGGDLNVDNASRFGRRVAETTLDEFKSAFTKKGIGNLSSGFNKPN